MRYIIITITILAFTTATTVINPNLIEQDENIDIDSMLEVEVIKKNVVKDHLREDIYMVFRFRNVSPNAISVFEGDLTFRDISGKELKKVAILRENPLNPGDVVDVKYMLDHNDFLERDITLATMPLENLDASWDAKSITLKNGKELTDE